MTGDGRPRWAGVQRLGYRVWGYLPPRLTRALVRFGSSNYLVGTHPVVQRADGRILLVRHTYGSGWSTPGGFVNRREHPLEGAVREVREEVGLDVEVIGEPIVFFEVDRRMVQVAVSTRPIVDGHADHVVPRSLEIAAARWFPLTSLPEMQLDVAESVRRWAEITGQEIV